MAKKPALAIGCVYYRVKDMGRAVRFYTKTLGLPLVVRYDDDWAEVDAGTTRIGLHPAHGKVEGGGATVSFYVKDLDTEARRLKRLGAKRGPIHATPRGKMAMLSDSEGNALHFSEFAKEWVRDANYPLPRTKKKG